MGDGVRILAGDTGPARPRLPLTAITVVLLALVLGLVVGRATAPEGDARPSGQSPAPHSGGQPAQRVGSVPVGCPRTRAGAVAATLNAGAVLGDPRVLLDASRRSRVLELIATDRYASTFTGPGAAALHRARDEPLGRGLTDGARTIALTSPLSYRVTSYSDDAVQVVSWGVAVVGNDAGLAPVATWATTTTQLRWQDGDWKIDAADTQPGPTPGLARGAEATDAAGFIEALRSTSGVRHGP